MHNFSIIEGDTPQRDFKIGVAIPCFWKDTPLLSTCVKSVLKLNPQPFITVIDINYNSNLNEVRRLLFEKLFYEFKCDVVLSCDVDFYLISNILKFIKRNRIVTFNGLSLRRYDLTLNLYYLIFLGKMGWTGFYSIPVEFWEEYKDKFDGYDSSIWREVGRFNYDFHLGFGCYNLRPYKKSSVKELLKTKSCFNRFVWSLIRLGVC